MSAAVAERPAIAQQDLLEPRTAHPVAVQEPRALSPAEQSTPVHPTVLLRIATERGASPEYMMRLLEVVERFEQNEARKAFNESFASFKAETVKVLKGKHVEYMSSKGLVAYDHAELFDLVDVVGPLLSKHGFSWNWIPKQGKGWVEITCVLRHRLGHEDTATLGGPVDETGGKNANQAIGSTVTYMERYTFKAITGIAEGGQDDDGALGPRMGAGQDDGAPWEESQGQRTAQAPAADPAPSSYDQKTFDANLNSSWRGAIESGRQSADRIIAFIEANNKTTPLTEAQKTTLRAIKRAAK